MVCCFRTISCGTGARCRTEIRTLDTWTVLSYLAAKTRRLMLGTLVTPVPFRPPGILAKMVATLDVITSGRAILGVGAGWSQTEFQGYSEWTDGKTRVDKTEEGVQLILKLWHEDKVDFHGRYYKAQGAVLEPKPVQKPHPPLLFGGSSPRMLRLAGRVLLTYRRVPLWVISMVLGFASYRAGSKIGLAILYSISRGCGPVGDVQEDG